MISQEAAHQLGANVSKSRTIRRVAAATGTAIMALAAADQGGAALRWTRGQTSVQFLEEPKNHTDAAWFFFPGLGQADSTRDARALAPFLDAPAVTMHLPQRLPSVKKIGRAVATFVEEHNIERFRPYGRSMGWLTAGSILPYLPKGVVVDEGFADGTPHDIADAKDGHAARIINTIGYPGGILTMGIVEALSFQTEPGAAPGNIGQRFRHAWHNMLTKDCSPVLWTWQIGQLCAAEDGQLARNFRDRLTPDAKLAYFMSDQDNVVDVRQATEKLKSTIGHPITVLTVPDSSHAQPHVHFEKYGPLMTDFLGGAALSDAVEFA